MSCNRTFISSRNRGEEGAAKHHNNLRIRRKRRELKKKEKRGAHRKRETEDGVKRRVRTPPSARGAAGCNLLGFGEDLQEAE